MTVFESFIPEIFSYFENAKVASDLRSRTFSLCEKKFRINYSSEMLENYLFKAFEHLEDIGTNHSLIYQIFACDGNILKKDLPGWKKIEELSGSEKKLVIYNKDSLHILYNPDSQIFSMVDTLSGRAWYYVTRASRIPFYEKAAPMRMILHWLCEMFGSTMVHAAAIGYHSKAALLAGRSGTGKSTTALLAAQNGFRFLGDDYVVLDNSIKPVVFSAYNSIKFRWDMLERLSLSETLIVNDPEKDEKGYFYMQRIWNNNLIRKMPLEMILLPMIEKRSKTTFTRISPARGLLALSASSIFQMPGSGQTTLKRLADILRDIPVYQMSMGTDNFEILESLKYFMSKT